MPRSPFQSPLDLAVSAYRASLLPDAAFSPEYRWCVEEAVFLGGELYETLRKRYDIPLDDGIAELRRLPADKALEAVRQFRDWLRITRETILPAADSIEQTENKILANCPLLHCYADRMEGLITQWDATLTQANVVYRDTDLSEEESRIFHESMASRSRGRVRLKTPPPTA